MTKNNKNSHMNKKGCEKMSIFTDEKRKEIKTKLLKIGIDMIKQKGIKKMTIDDEYAM